MAPDRREVIKAGLGATVSLAAAAVGTAGVAGARRDYRRIATEEAVPT